MSSNVMSPTINCPDAVVRAGAQGVESVAVDDQHAQLLVTFFHTVVLPQESYLLSPASYTLTGGQRLFPNVIKAEAPPLTSPPSSPPQPSGRQILLTLDGEGDFSIYTLTVSGPDIDPLFSSYKLRFRLGCDERFDCRPPAPASPAPPELPVTIDYLSKDYASFRQALLDFVPTRLPAWTERSEADIGMMLLELLAYTGDNLSYMQDRVGNEAFLDTATQRRSVACHLQLIGYQMDEGASAYTWLQFQVNTRHDLTPGLKISNHPKTQADPLIVFEPLAEATLYPQHNAIRLYTWDENNCCLPHGALSAALDGGYGNLNEGDYLLFDDGQGHRDIVRITSQPVIALAPVPSSPPSSPPAEITVVSWSAATPLHFDYCTTAMVVRGNLVVATHGETIAQPDTFTAPAPGPRLRITLSQGPLAHLDASTLALTAPVRTSASASTSAGGFTQLAPRSVSTLVLTVGGDLTPWRELTSLLDSGPNNHVYRVEIDDQGGATVVFGQGGTNTTETQFGLQPAAGALIEAVYRVGGGSNGNVSADTLVEAYPVGVDALTWLDSVSNPLPASGGRDLESRDHARRVAPPLFHDPLVAVTIADYERAAQQFSEPGQAQPIQRANAAFRWTGSWLTVTLGADPMAAEGLSPDLRSALLAYLDTRRLAGYDLEINGPEYLPIDLIMNFCVTPGSRSASVQQQIELALSDSALPGGGKGFFHPDNFSFGDSLYVSQLFAAVMAVPGVDSARITRLARLHSAFPDTETQANLRQGFLPAGPDQIIRLDNDRNFPENGVLTVQSLETAQ